MDFSSQYQFTVGQAYQPFMSVPPLTPSNSHSAASDDYNTNTTSPPHAFDTTHNRPPEQFPDFAYGHTFPDAAPLPHHGFSNPPTPPDLVHFTAHPAGLGAQDGTHLQQKPPAGLEPEVGPEDPSQLRPGSDDDESLTPAQSRRKAQNRAAQRAFRERKEKHVKDLEAKLADMEAARQQATLENERLKKDLHKISTENEILRATSSMANKPRPSYSAEPATTGPMNYSPTDFYSNVLQNHPNKRPSHRIVTSDDGERLLAAGATWDFIVNHDLYRRGLVDVGDVSDRLKTCARCDGQGPVFSERAIVRAMEQSVSSGSDDLL
ncbi:hypothetical protein E4U42_004533 [Claviceps africana]|uniref:BZIP domain-containing protein n=1 Tax=Claviceps africana TaxID=83212 RepID=A0A8K0NI12_9HYPO|nr:hypothetical protein E4U42_004533 [Claviceps africana]